MIQTEFKDKKVVLVSVPGAFTPTCQNTHVQGYIEKLSQLLFCRSYGRCQWDPVSKSLYLSKRALKFNISLVLNVEQFRRFMTVIKKLGERVEREHNQHLRDSQRIEDRSITANSSSAGIGIGGSLDFESLVGGASGNHGVKPEPVVGNGKTWEDDVWGSLLGSGGSEVRSAKLFAMSNRRD